MSKCYVSCPVCNYFFSYDDSQLNPDNSILLTCPRCNHMFCIQIASSDFKYPDKLFLDESLVDEVTPLETADLRSSNEDNTSE